MFYLRGGGEKASVVTLGPRSHFVTVAGMSDLAPRSGGPPSRRSREQRAYRLAVAGGLSATATFSLAVLAVFGVTGWGLPVLTAIVAVICLVLFRRTVGS